MTNNKHALCGQASTSSLVRVLGLGLLALVAGCVDKRGEIETASTQPASTQPVTTVEIRETDCQSVDEMDFLDCMVRKTKCSVADAVRAVGMLIEGHDIGKTFDERYQALLDRDIVRPAWKLESDQWIDRGTLAYMLYKVANLKGGVNMVIFGSWGLGDRRYAYREMRYLGLMQEGVDYNYVSGPELVTTVGKVDNYIQDRERNSPATQTSLGESPQCSTP